MRLNHTFLKLFIFVVGLILMIRIFLAPTISISKLHSINLFVILKWNFQFSGSCNTQNFQSINLNFGVLLKQPSNMFTPLITKNFVKFLSLLKSGRQKNKLRVRNNPTFFLDYSFDEACSWFLQFFWQKRVFL